RSDGLVLCSQRSAATVGSGARSTASTRSSAGRPARRPGRSRVRRTSNTVATVARMSASVETSLIAMPATPPGCRCAVRWAAVQIPQGPYPDAGLGRELLLGQPLVLAVRPQQLGECTARGACRRTRFQGHARTVWRTGRAGERPVKVTTGGPPDPDSTLQSQI